MKMIADSQSQYPKIKLRKKIGKYENKLINVQLLTRKIIVLNNEFYLSFIFQ
jgi:hypothetical protein